MAARATPRDTGPTSTLFTTDTGSEKGEIMDTILILVVLVLLFGGGGFYWNTRRR